MRNDKKVKLYDITWAEDNLVNLSHRARRRAMISLIKEAEKHQHPGERTV
jgi:hypothetical protein